MRSCCTAADKSKEKLICERIYEGQPFIQSIDTEYAASLIEDYRCDFGMAFGADYESV